MRIDRHSVMYQCDHCPRRVVAYDGFGCPVGPMPPLPEGWSYGQSIWQDVHLCSAKCLRECVTTTEGHHG